MTLWTLKREPGFRLNIPDVLIIGGCLALSFWLRAATAGHPLWWIPAYGAASFFVWCNVLRVATVFELPWLAAMLAATALGLERGWDLPVMVPLLAEPFRWLMVWWALRIGWYRGVGWRWLNARYGFPPEQARGPRPPFRLPW